MPIVQSILGQILDGVYAIETQSPPSIQGISTGIIKMAGSFSKGIPGAVYSESNYPSAVSDLGPSLATVDGPICLQALFYQKAGGVQVAPVFGVGAGPASITLQDSQITPGNVLTLTAADPNPQTGAMSKLYGTDANQMTATVAQGIGSLWNVTIAYGNQSETYTGLTNATAVATINAASQISIASLPTSPSSQVPKAGSFTFTGGSNGTAGDSDFVGTVDGSGNRTGLKALEPVTGNSVLVANQYSSTINTALSVHGNSFNCIPCMAAPPNSTVASTTTANNYAAQDNVAFCDGWRTILDADTGLSRQVSPAVWVAGMAAQLPVYKDWGNKTIYGSTGAVTPRSSTDLATLQQAGVICVTDGIPRGGCGTNNGTAADGSDIYIRAMRYFEELSIMNSLGWAVDEMQSDDIDDPLRNDVLHSVSNFLQQQCPKNPSATNPKVINSFSVVCSIVNNPDSEIVAGHLNLAITIKLLGSAHKIIIYANISPSAVTVSSQAA
jgi:hypothetical protein